MILGNRFKVDTNKRVPTPYYRVQFADSEIKQKSALLLWWNWQTRQI